MQQQQDEKNFRPNLNPDNKKPKGPKFSIYWIYGLVVAILLGYNIFNLGMPDTRLTTPQKFRDEMLAKGDVAKLDYISNRKIVRIYIAPDSLNKPF